MAIIQRKLTDCDIISRAINESKYRIGISENLLGDKRYQCQIKRFGIWWNDESFSTKERMLDYARKLEKAGHIVFNYL